MTNGIDPEHGEEFDDWDDDCWEEEDSDEVVRAKWTIDGATTLKEASEMASGFAAYLMELDAKGYLLRSPVNDDYGFYYHPHPETLTKKGDNS